MEILVCIKQVPDTPTIRIDEKRMTIIREGVESIINPLDGVALEAALELRERHGGRVHVMTMGPPQSEAALREALGAGADTALLLTDPAFAGADTLATSHVLAGAILKMSPFPDIILCGMKTIDSDTGHVGPQIAEELDLPQICGVHEIHRDGDSLMIKRVSDGFLDTIRVTPPVVLTVTHGLRPLRDLSLGALERAFGQEQVITSWGLDDLGLSSGEVGFSGSATRVWRLRPPGLRRKGERVSGSPQDMVSRIIQLLEELNMLDEKDEQS